MQRYSIANERPVSLVRNDDGTAKLTGYGAVFYRDDDPGTEFQLNEKIWERVGREAFNDTLAKDDVRSMFNHDPNMLLGRTKAGTLRLSVDDIGLRYEVDLPDTSAGRDIAASVERGDVDGSSFWFAIDGESRSKEDRGTVVTIEKVTLREVGPVVFPAYKSTTAAMRQRVEEVQADVDRESQAQKQKDLDEIEATFDTFNLTIDQS